MNTFNFTKNVHQFSRSDLETISTEEHDFRLPTTTVGVWDSMTSTVGLLEQTVDVVCGNDISCGDNIATV